MNRPAPHSLAGGRTFRCAACGFLITLLPGDDMPVCPNCGRTRFVPGSLFHEGSTSEIEQEPVGPRPPWLRGLAGALGPSGCYLAFDAGGRGVCALAVEDGFMRIGRSFTADLRLDDATVSRRHALIHRDGNRVTVVDDRSLNGVFVNGERVDWRPLADGDEIRLGGFRLYFVRPAPSPRPGAAEHPT